MKKIFIAYGHHNTTNSFNSAIRDTFIDEAKKRNILDIEALRAIGFDAQCIGRPSENDHDN